jgi:predicted transcriptional regulator
MAVISRRSKIDIYTSILESIRLESGRLSFASPTRVAHRANIPYARFIKYVNLLIHIELINRTNNGLIITPKGLDCLDEFRKTNDFLKKMGLKIS